MEHVLAWWRASGLFSASSTSTSVDIVKVQEAKWFDEYCATYSNEQKTNKNAIACSPLPRETQKQKQFWSHFYQRMTPFFAAVLLPNLFFSVLIAKTLRSTNESPISGDYYLPFRVWSWTFLSAICLFYLLVMRFDKKDRNWALVAALSPRLSVAVIAKRIAYMLIIFRTISLLAIYMMRRPFGARGLSSSSKELDFDGDGGPDSISVVIFDLLYDCLESCVFLSVLTPMRLFARIFLVLCIVCHIFIAFSEQIVFHAGMKNANVLLLVSVSFDIVAYFSMQLFYASELRSFEAFVEHKSSLSFLREIITLLSSDVKVPLQYILSVIKADFAVQHKSTHMHRIFANMKIISLLTDDLMTLIKIEQGRAHFDTARHVVVHLPTLIKSTISSFQPPTSPSEKRAPSTVINVDIQYDFSAIEQSSKSASVLCEKESLELILKNLHVFLLGLGGKSPPQSSSMSSLPGTSVTTLPLLNLPTSSNQPPSKMRFCVVFSVGGAEEGASEAAVCMKIIVKNATTDAASQFFDFNRISLGDFTSLLTCARIVDIIGGSIKIIENCVHLSIMCKLVAPHEQGSLTEKESATNSSSIASSIISAFSQSKQKDQRQTEEVKLQSIQKQDQKPPLMSVPSEQDQNVNAEPKPASALTAKAKWTGGAKTCRVCVLSESVDDQNFIAEILEKAHVLESNIVYLMSIVNDDEQSSKFLKEVIDVVVVTSDMALSKLRDIGYNLHVILLTGVYAYLDESQLSRCSLILPIPCYESDVVQLIEWFEIPRRSYAKSGTGKSDDDLSELSDGPEGIGGLGSGYYTMYITRAWLRSTLASFLNSGVSPLFVTVSDWVQKKASFISLRDDGEFVFWTSFVLIGREIAASFVLSFGAGEKLSSPASSASQQQLQKRQKKQQATPPVHYDLGTRFDFKWSIFGVSMFSSDIEESLCKWRILSPTSTPAHHTYFIHFSGSLFVFIGLTSAYLNRPSSTLWKTMACAVMFLMRGKLIRYLFFNQARIYWTLVVMVSASYFLYDALSSIDTFWGLDSPVEAYEIVMKEKFGFGNYTGAEMLDWVSGCIVVGWGFYFPWPFALLLPLSALCQLLVIFFVCIVKFCPTQFRLIFILCMTTFFTVQITTLFYYEQRHRTEFQLLRKNQFAKAFMQKLFDLFAKEIMDPIGEILNSNKALSREIADGILLRGRNRNSAGDTEQPSTTAAPTITTSSNSSSTSSGSNGGSSGTNDSSALRSDLFSNIGQFSRGHCLLQELHYELEMKQTLADLELYNLGETKKDTGGNVSFQGPRQVVNMTRFAQHLALTLGPSSFEAELSNVPIFIDVEPSMNLVLCDEKLLSVCCINALNRALKATQRAIANNGLVSSSRTFQITLSVKPQDPITKKLKFNQDRLMLIEVWSSVSAVSHSFGDVICKGIVLQLHPDAIFEMPLQVPEEDGYSSSSPDIAPQDVDDAPSSSTTAASGEGSTAPTTASSNNSNKSTGFLMQRFSIPYSQHPER